MASIAPFVLFASVSALALCSAPALADTVFPPGAAAPYVIGDEDLTVLEGATILDAQTADPGLTEALAVDVSTFDYSHDIANFGSLGATADGKTAESYLLPAINAPVFGGAAPQATALATTSGGMASAQAIAFAGDISAQGSLANSGLIFAAAGGGSDADVTASALAVAYAGSTSATAKATAIARAGGATASGVVIAGDLAGSVSNGGSISALATGGMGASAVAAAAARASTAPLLNASALASAQAGAAVATGLAVGDDLAGSIVNSGSITLNAVGGFDAFASATAFALSAFNATNGDDTVSAKIAIAGRAGNADAAALVVAGELTGSLANGGTVEVLATGGSSATATANAVNIHAGKAANVAVAIAVSALAGNATAAWLDVASGAALVTNSGQISVTAFGGDDAAALAFTSGNDATSGNGLSIGAVSISAEANARAGGALAFAVRTGESLASLSNSGTITVFATGGDRASATASMLSLAAGPAALGSVMASQHADVEAGNATAYGMDAGLDVVKLNNAGILRISAAGGSTAAATARAFGALASQGAVLEASVLAHAEAGNGLAYGVNAGADLSNLTNSGTIDVTGTGGSSNSAVATAQSAQAIGAQGSAHVLGSAFASAGNGTAFGVNADGSLIGTLVNGGSIIIHGNGGYQASATALAGVATANVSGGTGKASASIFAYAGSGVARGIHVGTDLSGSLSNTGLIVITADAGELASAEARQTSGVEIRGTGSTGTASVLAAALAGNAFGVGIDVGRNLSGDLSNAGSISVDVLGGGTAAASLGFKFAGASGLDEASAVGRGSASAGNAIGHGILAGGMDGTLSNSGQITITATAGRDAFATAFSLQSVEAHDAGTGKAYAWHLAAAGNARADGILIETGVAGDVTSSGKIIAVAYGGSDATAVATVLSAHVHDVTNGYATASAFAYAGNGYANGISLRGELSGALANSGAINVAAFGGNGNTATASASAKVVDASGIASALASAEAGAGNANAMGLGVRTDVLGGGSLENSGSIVVTAEAGDSNAALARVTASGANTGEEFALAEAGVAHAYGMRVGNDLSGTLSNSGSINVTATGGDGNLATADTSNTATGFPLGRSGAAFADGIAVERSMDGRLTNSGSIAVLATGGQSNAESNFHAGAQAFGIRAGDADTLNGGVADGGILTSSGTIFAEAVAFGDADAEAYGVFASNVEPGGTVVVAGKTVARVTDTDNPGRTVGDDAYAIWLGGGAGLLEVNAPAFLEGRVRVEDQDVTLTSGPGTAAFWTFDDVDQTTGTYRLKGALPWYVRNGGTASPTYASYDPSLLAAQANAIADLAGMVSRLGEAGVAKAGGGKARIWAAGLAGDRSYAGDGKTTLDQDTTAQAVALGASFEVSEGASVTVLGGYNEGSVEEANGPYAGAASSETSGGFAGIYGELERQKYTIAGGVAGGIFSQDTSRVVNNNLVWGGLENVAGGGDGYWFSPEVSGSMRFEMSERVAFRPTMTGRYVYGSIDGYSESGAEGAAEVGDQTVSVFEADASAVLEVRFDAGTLSFGGGYLLRRELGDDSVDVAIFGVSQAMPINASDGSVPYAEAGFSVSIADRLTLDLNARMLFPADGDAGVDAMAKLGFNF